MRRILLAFSLLLLPSLASASPPQRQDLPHNTASMVHIDVDAIQAKKIGRELLQQVLALPPLKKQLAALPETLAFLKEVRAHDITVIGFEGDDEPSSLVVVARLDYDQKKTLALLQSARDYAEVSYHGIPVHQWRANMQALGDMLLERQRSEAQKEKDEFKPIFLATPDASTVMLSMSLQRLTHVLDRRQGRVEMIDEARFQSWTKRDNCLIHVAFDQEEDGFPSNVIAQLCVAADEKVTIVAQSRCLTDHERQVGRMMANVVNDFEKYANFAKVFLPQAPKDGDAKQTTTIEAKTEVVADDDAEAEKKSSDGERSGKLTFSVSVDGKNPPGEESSGENWIAEVGELIARTASASFEDDTLKVVASAYPNEWKVELITKDSVDEIRVQLSLFSSKEKYLAAQPKAKKAVRR